jgi:predicted lipid-binding transport protein (Tim44 family)
MDGNSFPIDLILFGMIAAFLVLRLRSILGRRQGFERPVAPVVAAREAAPAAEAPTIDGRAEPAQPKRTLPDAASASGQALARMAATDPAFRPEAFLAGAERAFALIVDAYASGARDTLRPLLSPDMFAAFETAIAAREAAGETQRTEIRHLAAAAIEDAALNGSVAVIGVRFVSDQVNVTVGKDGLPVSGADAVMEITDAWTFERDLSSPDPTWRLTAARSA